MQRESEEILLPKTNKPGSESSFICENAESANLLPQYWSDILLEPESAT
ncbi:hypothetical protein IQ269_22680 [Tychonema sp. LEGE 07199]|nr:MULTISPECIES: hypothetical protein [unclassified Tychonema]MBE9123525.1 hypothetical protein [Tychonema sp. LEGE 07199]MBE9134992.1 hypothetical protein [Tychonema sp. LEGE 07196]